MVYANEVTEASGLSLSALPSCAYGPHDLVNDYIKKCVLNIFFSRWYNHTFFIKKEESFTKSTRPGLAKQKG
jgi:hypothetical protein